ncbi:MULTISPECIES: GNAT family N-acetyltransferase [Solibacillus]|uniref:GNAT family N-acetyltransferase n=1 Tax=Solibacillus merdavium TaxID=2762218 RepID=A0ABR8XR57_9BACL|nr:GNAT family N-acetyltransferase [Solibacillus merdavium]MBD8034424.1 GNAT family N-acetyltransferase [Solibacillus merdavium]
MLKSVTKEYHKEILDLWNTCLPDFRLTDRLLEQNTWQSPYVLHEGSALKEVDGKVVGVVIAKMWHETHGISLNMEHGWIQMLLVHPDYRQQEIGTELYKFAEQALLKNGVKKIQIGGDLGHLLCGVPLAHQAGVAFAEMFGFKQVVESVDFTKSITEPLSLPEKDNVEFVLLEKDEQQQLLEFMEQSFPGRWTFEAYDYFAQGGTGRDYVVVKWEGKIVGFCRINDELSAWKGPNYNWAEQFDQLGGIGPLGVNEDYRKYGLGRAVIEAAEFYLQQRGKKTFFIDWTDLIAFYEKLGYTVWKNYGIFVKQVD